MPYYHYQLSMPFPIGETLVAGTAPSKELSHWSDKRHGALAWCQVQVTMIQYCAENNHKVTGLHTGLQ